MSRRKKTGRPQGGWEINPAISNLNILDDTRRSSEPSNTINSPSTSARSASPKTVPKQPAGSKSRPKPYLFDKLDTSFGYAKLPKSRAVLQVFLSKLEKNMEPDGAAQVTLNELKLVWKHHFGMRALMAMIESTKIMIIKDIHANTKIISL